MMKHNTITTASAFFTYGWARFMGAGYFAMVKKDKR